MYFNKLGNAPWLDIQMDIYAYEVYKRAFRSNEKTFLIKKYNSTTILVRIQPDASAKSASNTAKQTVLLIIVDNDDFWTIVSLMFKRQLPAVSFHRVVNVQQALDYLDKSMGQPQIFPTLIRQNLSLPLFKDGLNLREEIQAKLATYSAQQIPILVMRSSDSHDDIRRAYQAGASSFYRKPTDMHQWDTYFERLRRFWLESVTLPVT